jgi:hypothetical protein
MSPNLMQVFCNLLQIIKGLPFNPWLGHISQFFYLYLPNLNLNSVLFKNQLKFVIVQRKKKRAMSCITEISLPPTNSVDSIHIGME